MKGMIEIERETDDRERMAGWSVAWGPGRRPAGPLPGWQEDSKRHDGSEIQSRMVDAIRSSL